MEPTSQRTPLVYTLKFDLQRECNFYIRILSTKTEKEKHFMVYMHEFSIHQNKHADQLKLKFLLCAVLRHLSTVLNADVMHLFYTVRWSMQLLATYIICIVKPEEVSDNNTQAMDYMTDLRMSSYYTQLNDSFCSLIR